MLSESLASPPTHISPPLPRPFPPFFFSIASTVKSTFFCAGQPRLKTSQPRSSSLCGTPRDKPIARRASLTGKASQMMASVLLPRRTGRVLGCGCGNEGKWSGECTLFNPLIEGPSFRVGPPFYHVLMRKNGACLESTRAAEGRGATRQLTYRWQSDLFYTQHGVVSAASSRRETDNACAGSCLTTKCGFRGST